MDKKKLVSLWYFLLVVIAMFYLQEYVFNTNRPESISYSEMIKLLENGQVASIEVNDQYIRGHLKSPRPGGSQNVVTARLETDLARLLSQYDVEYRGIIESHLLGTVLSWVMPMLIFLGFWYFLMRRMGSATGGLGGMTAIGKSKAKVYVETDTQVNFDDVAGVDEAKLELQEIVSFLKQP